MTTALESTAQVQRRRLLLAAATSLAANGTAGAAWAATVGSGRAQTDNRTVGEFDAIAVSGSIELQVRQGEKEAVAITADDNLLPLIETVVESGRHGRTLSIRPQRGANLSTRNPIKAVVDVVRLQSIAAAGSGPLRIGSLKTPSLRLSMAGSGDARFDALSTDTLELRIAGSGNVQASGTAGQVKITISGSGNVDLLPLVADDVAVRIAGSGDAKVTANKALSVSIAGSGDVVYAGAVTAVRSSIAGSGKVSRR